MLGLVGCGWWSGTRLGSAADSSFVDETKSVTSSFSTTVTRMVVTAVTLR
jgi:hypothetical protein